MNYKTLKWAGAPVHIFEYDPLRDPSQVGYGQPGLKETLSRIGHPAMDAAGYEIAAKVNFGFFSMSSDVLNHIGSLWMDSGRYEIQTPDNGMECYLLKDGRFKVASVPLGEAEALKDQIVWGGSLGYALIIEGKKDLRMSENFSHAKYKASRTMIGQMPDATMILAVADAPGLTALEEADLMFSLGCTNAINADGGGSSEMIVDGQIKNKPSDGSERRIGSALMVFKKKAQSSKPEIILDPGHGGKDPGGGSCSAWTEKEKVLQISLYQKQRLEAHGIRVAITRTTDVTLEPTDRTAAVRGSGAPICISNHVNAGGGRGAETIHSIYSDGKLAHALADGIAAAGQQIRRVFTRTLPDNPKKDYYFMHRDTGSTETVIVEYGFADNQYDAELITRDWQRLAEAVVLVLVHYLGRAYEPPAADPQPPKQPDPAPATNDWETHWAAKAIEYVMDRGYMVGDGGGKFAPDRQLTRAELAQVLYEYDQKNGRS